MFIRDHQIKLRYVGERFSSAQLPVDMLSDLPAFRDLIVAFAKEIWRDKNSTRKRLPRGFEKSISFNLSAIERGSAVPCLKWNNEDAQRYLPFVGGGHSELIAEALNGITTLFLNTDEQESGNISTEKLRALNKFGSSLRELETIELLDLPQSSIVSFTAEKRRRLLRRAGKTYTIRYEGIGTLTGVKIPDGSQFGTITIQTEKYNEISIVTSASEAKQDFDGNIGDTVQFDLLLEIDANDNLKLVAELLSLTIVESDMENSVSECSARLSELESLQDGWHDGDGLAISSSAIEAGRQIIAQEQSLASKLRIYPSISGGISIEFNANGWELSIEVLATGQLELCGVNLDTSDETREVFDTLGEQFFSRLHMLTQNREQT